MFKNNFVVSVKANGKILREDKESVFIPFGQEYTLLFKNLNSKKAVVSVFIDGKDMLSGKKLVVDPNSDYELKRMITSNNGVDSDKGYAFKFIEFTSKMSDYRGQKADDGIIRVEVQYEESNDYNPFKINKPNLWGAEVSDRVYEKSINCNDAFPSSRRITIGNDVSNSVLYSTTATSSDIGSIAASTNTDGITTQGSYTQQSFTPTIVGALEKESTVISLKLVGAIYNKPITEPITVKTKIECTVCGFKNQSSANFCSDCGTNLK